MGETQIDTPLVRELHVAAVSAPRLLDGLDLISIRRVFVFISAV